MNRFRKMSDDRGVFTGLQALESRELMSAVVNISPQGALEVVGDSGNNSVAITVQKTPKGSLAQVVVDGVKLNLPPNLVTSVGVRAGGGHDKVSVKVFGDNSSVDVFGNVNPLWVYVEGEAGNDEITLKGVGTATTEWSGSFSLSGGSGKDTIEFFSDSFVYANGGNGDDKITVLDGGLLWAPTHSISGDGYQEVGNDRLVNLGETSVNFNGGAGNDIIIGSSADEYFNGGTGNDTLYGGPGNDQFDGGSGTNLIYGGEGNNTYYFSSDGKDTIKGGSGYDSLYGYSAAGFISFDGGEGSNSAGFVPGAFLFHVTEKRARFVNIQQVYNFGDGGGKG